MFPLGLEEFEFLHIDDGSISWLSVAYRLHVFYFPLEVEPGCT